MTPLRTLFRIVLLSALISPITWFAPAPAHAGDDYRTVFELTGEAADQWTSLLNNVENVRTALPGVQVTVVAHGPGLRLLMKDRNADVASRMEALTRQGVTFAACQNTMKRMKVGPEDLSPFAKTVDSGVAEVIRKQQAGWAYIRSGG